MIFVYIANIHLTHSISAVRPQILNSTARTVTEHVATKLQTATVKFYLWILIGKYTVCKHLIGDSSRFNTASHL